MTTEATKQMGLEDEVVEHPKLEELVGELLPKLEKRKGLNAAIKELGLKDLKEQIAGIFAAEYNTDAIREPKGFFFPKLGVTIMARRRMKDDREFTVEAKTLFSVKGDDKEE